MCCSSGVLYLAIEMYGHDMRSMNFQQSGISFSISLRLILCQLWLTLGLTSLHTISLYKKKTIARILLRGDFSMIESIVGKFVWNFDLHSGVLHKLSAKFEDIFLFKQECYVDRAFLEDLQVLFQCKCSSFEAPDIRVCKAAAHMLATKVCLLLSIRSGCNIPRSSMIKWRVHLEIMLQVLGSK